MRDPTSGGRFLLDPPQQQQGHGAHAHEEEVRERVAAEIGEEAA
jgi:hypothetical protein